MYAKATAMIIPTQAPTTPPAIASAFGGEDDRDVSGSSISVVSG